MTAGLQASQNSINSTIGGMTLTLRNLCQHAQDFQMWITQTGQSGLVALGFSATDATAIINAAGYLNTIAQICQGQVQQGGSNGSGAAMFNFMNALAPLW